MIAWLRGNQSFPPVEAALREPNGLLAAGGDLSSARLLDAYSHGVFPWYSEGQPILWWSPDPRMVLFPAEFKLSRSLRKVARKGVFEVRADTAFRAVISACAAAERPGQDGTWITRDMIDAYCELHRLGYAHSVESWREGELVGGLYGVALGRVFFGESMFAGAADASKVAFAWLARQLERWAFGLIDCQQKTAHLARFGAREIPRREFTALISDLINYPHHMGPWELDHDFHE